MVLGISAVAMAADASDEVKVAGLNVFYGIVIAAGFGIALAAIGTGLAQGMAIKGAVEGTARNPEASGKITVTMIIGLAMIESLCIYALVIALILLYAVPDVRTDQDSGWHVTKRSGEPGRTVRLPLGAYFFGAACNRFHDKDEFRQEYCMKFSKIPAATITRLSLYSRNLEELVSEDVKVVSSEKLADRCGVNSAQIRKDLAYFGEFGVRGVGYYVRDLLFEIKKILGLNKEWNLAIVGMGNLGSALIAHENFTRQGYKFVAAFDVDPLKVGKKLPSGLQIRHLESLKEIRPQVNIEIGVISTPASKAQDVANRLIEADVRAILNFAPIQIQAPKGFSVENVDFTVKLDNLAYHLTTEN